MTPQRVGPAHPRVRDVLAVARNATARRLFVAEGAWAHELLLATGTAIETFLWCPEATRTQRARDCARRMVDAGVAAYHISEKVLARISTREKPDGLVSLARLPSWDLRGAEFDESTLVLVADGIEYAGNLGTLIRTADACRADCLLVTNRRVRLSHPRVFGASRGTILTTPVVEFDAADEAAVWLDSHGFEVFLADPASERTYRSYAFNGAPTAVVVGAEGQGPSGIWRARNATPVSIPMLGVADSLNVAASAAILAYEVRARKAGW
ncbi:TrmH family RNA methyltransferase [Actinopolymorpha alba]|uniref:TrmH family RNA methyltransferase n=1 Tax=Actinopolymorpha alba TaxID=533267 RepID=UPI00035D1A79|nr:TrmH family RNA methyltransferase [Actinopolymorpha alba]